MNYSHTGDIAACSRCRLSVPGVVDLYLVCVAVFGLSALLQEPNDPLQTRCHCLDCCCIMILPGMHSLPMEEAVWTAVCMSDLLLAHALMGVQSVTKLLWPRWSWGHFLAQEPLWCHKHCNGTGEVGLWLWCVAQY